MGPEISRVMKTTVANGISKSNNKAEKRNGHPMHPKVQRPVDVNQPTQIWVGEVQCPVTDATASPGFSNSHNKCSSHMGGMGEKETGTKAHDILYGYNYQLYKKMVNGIYKEDAETSSGIDPPKISRSEEKIIQVNGQYMKECTAAYALDNNGYEMLSAANEYLEVFLGDIHRPKACQRNATC
ncbi:hypothetical protein L1987_60755 [Smallanthus sonchifolius]|uniref:Uncharacterized protein n=1 Tax=Smallanthus sonchifolius TaxID=185202 RepID=A0ACB9D9B6_9ASTR|nr:hypothetical protein L1987_60755 [Smallanthus sonchifolius]